MRRTIEASCLPPQAAKPKGFTQGLTKTLLSRLFAGLRARAGRSGLIRLDSMSRHELRDIGLAEDVRGNHLLRDSWLRR
jgi:uncharacterized protein YjiS (DUF1127 family)